MTTNPWDVPRTESDGSPREDIFTSVGRALDAWEQLENWLGTLFFLLCETQSIAAKDAYGAIIAHATRNEMLKAATRAYFTKRDKTKQEAVLGLIDRVGKFAARRNEIAHGHTIGVTISGVDKGCYWIPPDYNIKKRRNEPLSVANSRAWGAWDSLHKYAYTANQIDGFAKHFSDLESEVMDLLRTWPPKSSPQTHP